MTTVAVEGKFMRQVLKDAVSEGGKRPGALYLRCKVTDDVVWSCLFQKMWGISQRKDEELGSAKTEEGVHLPHL